MSVRGVAIVGAGAFGLTHATAIDAHPALELRAVVGSTAESAARLADRFGVRSGRLDDVLADPSIDGVIIATPHATHLDLALRTLNADKHVLVEKPLAVTTAECDALLAAEKTSAGRGMVGHLMRWAPAHQLARQLLDRGTVGDVVAAESRRIIPWNWAERRPWHRSSAQGGGMWMVQGVHVLDQLSWLLDVRPDRIVGLSETRFHPDQDADDYGTALVRFGAVPVSVTIAGIRQGATEIYTQITGTVATMRVSHRGDLFVDTGDGWEQHAGQTADQWDDTLRGELDAFAEMMLGSPAEPDFAYGRHIVAAVEGVRRSQQSGSWEDIG